MKRREIIQSLAGLPLLALPRGLRAETDPDPTAPRLIVVMLRGAVDGLNVVIPYSESPYYRLRSSIAVPKPGQDLGALDLDGHFGLHPALSLLMPLWQSKRLAFVHASGSPDPTRSHFDAQDFMESGTPGLKGTQNGWMNRLLGTLPPSADASGLNAASFGSLLPRIFGGRNAVANVPPGRDASKAIAIDRPEISEGYDRMYAGDSKLGPVYREGRLSRERILADLNAVVSPENDVASNGAPPPQGFALDASQLATLILRNPGLRLSFMQVGDWDTHYNQGGSKGPLAGRLDALGKGLNTLVEHLGEDFDRTLIVVMSEFGRTLAENGTRGTDHGHGNVMWLLGGALQGGKVYGDWPGIDEASLYEKRDLAVTTDFRSVLAQVCERHLGLSDRELAAVFPQAPPSNAWLKGLFA